MLAFQVLCLGLQCACHTAVFIGISILSWVRISLCHFTDPDVFICPVTPHFRLILHLHFSGTNHLTPKSKEHTLFQTAGYHLNATPHTVCFPNFPLHAISRTVPMKANNQIQLKKCCIKKLSKRDTILQKIMVRISMQFKIHIKGFTAIIHNVRQSSRR